MPLRDLTFYLKNRPLGDAIVVEAVEEGSVEHKRLHNREVIVVTEEDSTVTTIYAGELDAHSDAPHKPAQEEEEPT